MCQEGILSLMFVESPRSKNWTSSQRFDLLRWHFIQYRYLDIKSSWTGLVTYIMCPWYIISVLSLRLKIPFDNWDFRCITKKSFTLGGIWRQTPARCMGRTWVSRGKWVARANLGTSTRQASDRLVWTCFHKPERIESLRYMKKPKKTIRYSKNTAKYEWKRGHKSWRVFTFSVFGTCTTTSIQGHRWDQSQ